jgi:hypothetical protein
MPAATVSGSASVPRPDMGQSAPAADPSGDAPAFPPPIFEPPAFAPPTFAPPVVEPRVESVPRAEVQRIEPPRAIDAEEVPHPDHTEWTGTPGWTGGTDWNSGESLRRRGVGVGVVEYMTVGPPASPFGQTGEDPERTTNGLLKRVPRSRAQTVPGLRTPTGQSPTVPPEPAQPAEDAERYSYEATPAEISARLASLRAGVARHEKDSAERGSRAR